MSRITRLLILFLACLVLIFVWRWPHLRKNGPAPDRVNFVTPSAEVHEVGSVFTYPLRLEDTHGTVNTVQADLGFDPLLLQVVDIETTGSFAIIFLQKIVDNQAGFVRLTGAIPNPGHAGGGTFGTIYFRARAPGDTVVHYLESCQILANDGHGTNLVSHFPHSYYHLTLEPSSSPNPATTPLYLLPALPTTAGTTPHYFYQYGDQLPSPPPKTHSPDHK